MKNSALPSPPRSLLLLPRVEDLTFWTTQTVLVLARLPCKVGASKGTDFLRSHCLHVQTEAQLSSVFWGLSVQSFGYFTLPLFPLPFFAPFHETQFSFSPERLYLQAKSPMTFMERSEVIHSLNLPPIKYLPNHRPSFRYWEYNREQTRESPALTELTF